VDLRDLEVFVRIARAGGFNRASERMFIAQSALSRRIAKLEHEVGTSLFMRSKRGVDLTPSGLALLERAEELLEHFDRVEAEVLSEATVPRGKLAIGLSPSLLACNIRFLQSYRSKYPLVQVHTHMGTTITIRTMLLEAKLDIGIVAATEQNTQVEEIPLFEDPLCLFVPSDHVTSKNFDWPMLSNLRLMLPAKPNAVRVLMESAALAHQLHLNVSLEANDVHLLMALTEAGDGSTVLPASAASLLRSDHTLIMPIPGLALRWAIATLRHKTISTAAREAIALAKDLLVPPCPYNLASSLLYAPLSSV
jgi:LysR family transcriptional regulator, nitrogen assimilation regulatory protein